jgi:hypothetical protein
VKFVTDPAIAVKIQRMKHRVRWQEKVMVDRGIDQTRLVIDDGRDDDTEFSFMVIGDSGSGERQGQNPQRQIAERMLEQRDNCRFILHTGDVIYLVGSSDYYPKNFIEPYREFLVNGENYRQLSYDKMVFNQPFLPVLGNHDYYDLPLILGLLAQATSPLRRLIQFQLDLDIGLRGSFQGKAYAQAFMDYLRNLDGETLQQHLDRHYTAKTETGLCLRYEPGTFTRLPNRYYTFRYGGIDFFALDSNTFNDPMPLPSTREGEAYRFTLEQQRKEMERQKVELVEQSAKLNSNDPEEADQLDDIRAKLAQIDEVAIDIEKQLTAKRTNTDNDTEQLEWLHQRLVESWHTEGVRGRIVFFHHPPYVTEATKWHQAQTMAVRYRLRHVLDAVAKDVGKLADDRPLVDLFLSGHAHCFEYIRTQNTGHADANLDWIVCGGSGHSLRRQREEGSELTEVLDTSRGKNKVVAKSHLFVGRHGQGTQKRRLYSYLKIKVQAGTPPKLVVTPYLAERSQHRWSKSDLDSFTIGSPL